jgi:DNA modification methylase
MPPVNDANDNGHATSVPYFEQYEPSPVRLYHGPVLNVLAGLPAGSVHCVVTSPPYWGLRDYGPGQACHWPAVSWPGGSVGPWLGALGSEPTPAIYIAHMVAVGRALRRVLRPDGTFWLNLGDTYSGYHGNARTGEASAPSDKPGYRENMRTSYVPNGPGQMVGVPWRVAFALQADGWVLRQDVVWSKPSPMPESVCNRCTKAHEYVFMLARGPGYYADMEAVKNASIRPGDQQTLGNRRKQAGSFGPDDPEYRGGSEHWGREVVGADEANKRDVWTVDDPSVLLKWLAVNAPDTLERYLADAANRGSVWPVAPAGYRGAHFATFPSGLAEVCLKIGTSAKGCCSGCGAPWRRRTSKEAVKRPRPNAYVKRGGADALGEGNACPNDVAGIRRVTLGWAPTCGCRQAGGGGVACTAVRRPGPVRR